MSRRRKRVRIFALISAVMLFAGLSSAAPSPHVRRIALLIGANAAPPGRPALRFAYEDARRLADALASVGRFAANDIHVLDDPRPEEIERVVAEIADVTRGTRDETLFFFYYSGHSDGQTVFPHGESMPLSTLRGLIAKVTARVRVGVLDTCRGGSWTQAKGLSLGPPLDPVELLPLASEGTALISSTSGFENAHEADAVRGSFFTHYFTAGLLGAADKSGDGSVTLQEAFEYSKERTVRDSARLATTTQHPSFDLQLRGRQDIVLTQVAASSSALDVRETQGPLEVIQLSSGITVLEIPAGGRSLRLALPPGRYLVRRVQGQLVRAKEITVSSDAPATLAEGELEAVGSEPLALKGFDDPERPISDFSTLPRNFWQLSFALGTTTFAGTGDVLYRGSVWLIPVLKYGITDRLEWRVPYPALAYRFGEPGKVEFVPRLGISDFAYGKYSGYLFTVDGGAALRIYNGLDQSLFIGAGAASFLNIRSSSSERDSSAPKRWGIGASVSYRWLIRNVVTIQPAAGIGWTVLAAPDGYPAPSKKPSLSLGSLSPLVSVHLTPRFSLDGAAQWTFVPNSRTPGETYMTGFTWNF